LDPLPPGKPVERTARDNVADDVAAAYVVGYSDGITLLRSDGHDEPLERTYARYLCNVEQSIRPRERTLRPPGNARFRDAAADNLPSPPHEIESQIHRVAA
jgi:hypothetical protein